MPACIIFNPTARGDKARDFLAQVEAIGPRCALKPTTGAGTAPQLAMEAVREGFDTIVAAGGDGTVNEVVNGIAQAPGGLEQARLGVLPLGTINVFAKELGLPGNLARAWTVCESGETITIDLPVVQTKGEVHHFAQLAGAGLDSRSIARVNWGFKKRFGPLAYVWAGLLTLAQRQPLVTVRGLREPTAGELVLLGNGRFYGGRIPMFPRAGLQDGLLHVRVFPRAHVFALFRFFLTWVSGRLSALEGRGCYQAVSVTLEASEAVPFELDGDNAGHLPATFSIRPRALRVLVPWTTESRVTRPSGGARA